MELCFYVGDEEICCIHLSRRQHHKIMVEAQKAWKQEIREGDKHKTWKARPRWRQMKKAKLMDYGSYEWSQWWHSKARKPKRWK